MNDDVTIRRATAGDADTMAALRRDMQAGLMELDGRSLPLDDVTEHNRAYFREKLPTGDFVAFVAECGGEIVGTSGIVVYHAPPTAGNPTGIEGYIMNMYTLPAFRGRRIATRLLDSLVDHMRSIGSHRVWLRASDQGRPVYRRYGFDADIHYMSYHVQDAGE